MSVGVVYVALVLSVYITNACGLGNVVRASQQCCQMPPSDDSAPAVSAVLLECPKDQKLDDGLQSDPNHAHRCEEQLMVNIRMNPSFQVEKSEKFLILDEVYDPRKRTKAKILSPYLVEISRGEPIMMYPLKFTKNMKCGADSAANEDDKSKCKIPNANPQYSPNGPAQNYGNKAESNSNKKVKAYRRNDVAFKTKDHRNALFARNSPANVKSSYDIYDSDDIDREVEESDQKNQPLMKYTIHPRARDVPYDSQPRIDYSDVEEDGDTFEDALQSNAETSQQIVPVFQRTHLGQFGLVESARNNKGISVDQIGTFDESIKTQNTDNSDMGSNQDGEGFRRTGVDNVADYSMLPLRDPGFLQEEDETSDEMGEYNPDNNPINSKRRFRNFVSGRRARKQGKHRLKKKGSRKTGSSYKSSKHKEVEGDDADYGGLFHNTAMSPEKPEISENYRNTAELKEPETKGSYENEESGENVQRYIKKGDRAREETFEEQEENLDENYGDMRRKQHVPARGNFDYAEENQSQAEANPMDGFEEVDNYQKKQEMKQNVGVSNGHYKYNSYPRYVDRRNTLVPQRDFFKQWSDADANTDVYMNTYHYQVPNHFQGNRNYGKQSFRNELINKHNNFNGRNFLRGQNNNDQRENFEKPAKLKPMRPPMMRPHHQLYKNRLTNSQRNQAKFRVNSETQNLSNQPRYSAPLKDPNLRLGDSDNNLKGRNEVKEENTNFRHPALAYDNYFLSNTNNDEPRIGNIDSFGITPMMYNPSPLSQSQFDVNSENAKYFYNKSPYATLLEDPKLSLREKLSIMDVIEPLSKKSMIPHKDLSSEVLNSYIVHATPAINPRMFTSAEKEANDNFKKKRSFVLYDDLEMRDTLDNDYNFDDADPQKSLQTVPRNNADDPAPCDTCGGKGKKQHGKTPNLNLQDNSCRCPNQPVSKHTKMRVRSVSDAWYSVFNMSAPLPFLTTQVRVFRKRHKNWCQVAPAITLTSLSGIFANANLSVLFSSHVDIFTLEKSLQLQNHQLLIPKDDRPSRQSEKTQRSEKTHVTDNENLIGLNLNPNNILAIEGSKFDGMDQISVDSSNNNEKGSSDSEVCLKSAISRPVRSKKPCDLSENGIRTIGELGYFPTSMNLLERCPNDKNRLCLNMLEDRVPAYSIKLKLPFRENALIDPNVVRVKIARIITDATTKNMLQVAVDVINKGYAIHEFSLGVYNCPFGGGGTKCKQQLLAPHIAETTTFLLPIKKSLKQDKTYTCDVVVKDISESKPSAAALAFAAASARDERRIKTKHKIVSVRQFTVKVEQRCLCIWKSKCHCIPKLETQDSQVCQKLSKTDQIRAGLSTGTDGDQGGYKIPKVTTIRPCDAEESEPRGFFGGLLHYLLLLLLILLFLGLVKAIVGQFIVYVDCWGYEYVQPGRSYCESSRCRRFIANTLFFIIFPFLFWCNCFKPSEEDLLVASTEWHLSLCRESLDESDDDDDDDDDDRCDYAITKSSDENRIQSQGYCANVEQTNSSSRVCGGEDFMNLDGRLCDWALAFHEGVFENDDDADEEANTKFVLQALVESRESLKKLLRTHSSQKLDLEDNPQAKLAEDLVSSLKSAQIVYRVFDRPVGNVRNIPAGKRYCMQGYFLPCLGTEYQFVNYNPLAQHRCYSARGTNTEFLRPPINLCPQDFTRLYKNKMDVLEAGDLCVRPPADAPCINIVTMAFVARSVAKLATDTDNTRTPQRLPQAAYMKDYSSLSVPPQQLNVREEGVESPPVPSFVLPEEGRDAVEHTLAQLSRVISTVNDEMMNEPPPLIDDESTDLVDKLSVESKCDPE